MIGQLSDAELVRLLDQYPQLQPMIEQELAGKANDSGIPANGGLQGGLI